MTWVETVFTVLQKLGSLKMTMNSCTTLTKKISAALDTIGK